MWLLRTAERLHKDFVGSESPSKSHFLHTRFLYAVNEAQVLFTREEEGILYVLPPNLSSHPLLFLPRCLYLSPNHPLIFPVKLTPNWFPTPRLSLSLPVPHIGPRSGVYAVQFKSHLAPALTLYKTFHSSSPATPPAHHLLPFLVPSSHPEPRKSEDFPHFFFPVLSSLLPLDPCLCDSLFLESCLPLPNPKAFFR